MALNGFALGGAAQGIEDAQKNLINQQQVNQTGDYQQGLLKLEQQRIQNEQHREMFSRIDKIRSEAMTGIVDTVNGLKINGADPTKIYKVISPWVEQLKKTTAAAGLDPSYIDAQIAATVQGANPLDTTRAITAAKVNPLEAAKPQLVGENPVTGDPVYRTYNPKTGQYDTPLNLGTVTGVDYGPNTAGTPQPTPNARVAQGFDATSGAPPTDAGDAFLARLPEGLRQTVKDVAEYRLNPTTLPGRIAKGQTQSARQRIVGLAEQYAAAKGDQYDQTQFTGRNAAIRAFSNGQEAKSVRSFNVLVSHLDTLGQAVEALNNKNTNVFNRVANTIATQTGQTAPTDFDAVRSIVGDEIVKAVIGSSSGALGDREEIKSNIDKARSPAQLRSMIEKYKELAGGQLSGLRQQYSSTTGRSDFDRFLSPGTKELFTQKGTPRKNAIPPPPPGAVLVTPGE